MQDKIGALQLGKRKISEYLKSQLSTTVSESQIQRYFTYYLYESEGGKEGKIGRDRDRELGGGGGGGRDVGEKMSGFSLMQKLGVLRLP